MIIDTPGAHNKNKPEIEARVSKIDVSGWNLLDGTTSNNIYGSPDAALSFRLCVAVVTIMFRVIRF